MDELKFHNFIREEIMKECELLKDLETQINYLREVRAEYITNPPELDENIRRAPRLEIYLDEKIKLIDEKLKYKPLQKTKGKTNRSQKEFSHEIVFILGAKLQDFIKPHLNKAKLINHRAAEKEEERAMYNAKYKEVPSLEFERNIEDFSENYNDDDSYEK
jgi:hypothetical protein